MDKIDLTSIKLGAPAAERDTGLEHYFVRSETYKRVANKQKTVVLGNRGAGKSAIFQMVAREARARNALSIELAPEDYSYEFLKSALATEGQGSWAKIGAYAVAWKYMIYVLIMQEIVKGSHGKILTRGPVAKIEKYISANHPQANRSKLSALVSYLQRIEGIKIGPVEASLKTRELDKLYRLAEINDLMPSLSEILEKQEVLVFVDELDRGWDGGEDAQAFVAGLFQACIAINSLSPNLTVYMSLRQELYDNIPALYEDAQKYRDLLETVTWNEEGLKGVIGARIRYASPLLADSTNDECWTTLFAETLSYRNNKSFNYMIDRTLYRPRELIQFATQTVDAALAGSASTPLDYNVISQSEITYSEDRSKDIAAEFRFQYPGLLSVFETFRGKVHTFDRQDLEYICLELSTGEAATSVDAFAWVENMEPAALIDVLWQVGFLRAQAVGGVKAHRRSGSSYLGPHQVGNLSLINLSRFQVHPMFRSFLGLREPKGGSVTAELDE